MIRVAWRLGNLRTKMNDIQVYTNVFLVIIFAFATIILLCATHFLSLDSRLGFCFSPLGIVSL